MDANSVCEFDDTSYLEDTYIPRRSSDILLILEAKHTEVMTWINIAHFAIAPSRVAVYVLGCAPRQTALLVKYQDHTSQYVQFEYVHFE